MSDGLPVPAGWTVEPLSRCVDVLDSNRKPVNSKERASRVGPIPYYGATGRVGWIDDHLFDEELVLVGEDGAPFFDKSKPIAYIIDGKSWVNNHAHVLRAKTGVTSNRYIKHYLDSFDFTGYVQGSTRDKLTQGAMNAIPVLMAPNPLQDTIVSIVDAVGHKRASAAAHLTTTRRAIERFRQAVLAAACSGRLTADWRERHIDQVPVSEILGSRHDRLTSKRARAIRDFDSSTLPSLPETWTWAPLAAVADSMLGKMLDKVKNKGQLRLYLRNINVRWRNFDLDDLLEMRFIEGEEGRFGLRAGDVLVCEGGEPGRSAVWRETGSDIRFQKALHRVRCETPLLPDWLVDTLQAHAGSGLLSNYFTGTGIAHLTGVSLARVPIPLPPVEEQTELVQRVDRLLNISDELQLRVATAEQKVDRSSQAILAKAFRGDLNAATA